MTTATLAGLAVFFVGVPAVTLALFAMPQWRRAMLALMVFTTCYVKKPFYQELFFVDYRGVDRGFAVTLPDLFFFGFFLHMLFGGVRHRVQWLPFNSLPWFLLIGISAASLVGSIEPYYGLFTLHKFVRCAVLYVVIANVVRSRADLFAVLGGLASAVLLQGFVVFKDKYITGAVVARSIGSFRHPNTLAMYIDLIAPVIGAAALTNAVPPRQRSLYATAVLVGFVCVLFTKSRGAMLLFPACLGTVMGISILMKPTTRKFTALGAALLAGGLIVAIALPRLVARFEKAPKESAETREYFNVAAEAMARDHPLGVGINLYSHALATTDYYWHVYPDRTEEPDPEAFRESDRGRSRLGTAHHIYWLYASETGWIGLAAFLLHIAMFWGYSVVAFLREKDHLFKSIYLGMVVGVAFHHVHGLLEWIFRQTEVQYLYFVLMGTMVAMARIRREEAAATPPARAPRAAVAAVRAPAPQHPKGNGALVT